MLKASMAFSSIAEAGGATVLRVPEAPESAADRRCEVRAVQDAMATGRGDAARVREELEVSGYGASATWKGGRS